MPPRVPEIGEAASVPEGHLAGGGADGGWNGVQDDFADKLAKPQAVR
jgi:hypothetical protein